MSDLPLNCPCRAFGAWSIVRLDIQDINKSLQTSVCKDSCPSLYYLSKVLPYVSLHHILHFENMCLCFYLRIYLFIYLFIYSFTYQVYQQDNSVMEHQNLYNYQRHI